MLLTLILALGAVLAPAESFAQASANIRGVVVSQANEPIIGATVIADGLSGVGTVTDQGGAFMISVPKSVETFTISYLGYKSQQVSVVSKSNIKVELIEETTALDEVQVIAYGTQSKVSVTGSMSNVSTDELVKVANASVTNALAGQMTGVSSVQSVGQPGNEDATIYIRGSSTLSQDGSDSPLILVDGVERSFSSLDPNEIADVTVLKDASSTAVFGVRGANGVILVTTRRGTEGKVNISFSSNVSIQTPAVLTDACDSYTTALLYNEQLANDNDTTKDRFSDFELEMYRTGRDPIMYPDTNWRDLIFKDAYAQTQHNVNISGGSERVRYFTSLSYLYQDGLIKQFDTLDYDNSFSYNRYNYRANLDIDITKTTSMKFNMGGVLGRTHEPNGHSDGLWRQVNWATPMSGPGLNADGAIVKLDGKNYPIPFKTGLEAFYGLGYTEKANNTLNIDLSVEQDLGSLVKGLKAHIKGAYNTSYTAGTKRASNKEFVYAVYESVITGEQTLPSTMEEYEAFDKDIVYMPGGANGKLGYQEWYGRTRNWYMEVALNYTRTFDNDHRVTGLLLYNQNRTYYPTAASGAAMENQYIPRSYLGLVGRATYSFRNKYLADVNVGYNGSENFAPGNTRFGLFPSGSLGWIISEENFLKDQNVISFLKVRASYGIVGNDKMGANRFLYMPSTWSVNSGGYNFGVDVSSKEYAAYEGELGNPVITWETAAKQNYGIDLKLLDSRLSLAADYFYEHRSGILIALNTPPDIIAATLPNMNLGETENRGYEVDLKWRDKFKNGSYYIGANVSFARNKILYMDEIEKVNDFNMQTGQSTGKTYGYTFERFYNEDDFDGKGNLVEGLPKPTFFGGTPMPGDCKYVDLDKDGDIDADDCSYMGYSTRRPEYTVGLNYGATWKGWNFSMQWLGATNVTRNLQTEYRIPFSGGGNRALFTYHAQDRWTDKSQETATLPRFTLTNRALNYGVNSSLWLKDASYIRLKNVMLGYTFRNVPFFDKMGLKNVNIYMSGYNVLTFDHIGFIDPESSPSGGKSNQYPINKMYTFGVKLNF